MARTIASTGGSGLLLAQMGWLTAEVAWLEPTRTQLIGNMDGLTATAGATALGPAVAHEGMTGKKLTFPWEPPHATYRLDQGSGRVRPLVGNSLLNPVASGLWRACLVEPVIGFTRVSSSFRTRWFPWACSADTCMANLCVFYEFLGRMGAPGRPIAS
jgi:hypothetical protein